MGFAADRELEMTPILPPVHPGEMRREEYLLPLKMSAGALAKKLSVSRTRIERMAAQSRKNADRRSS